jgi:hypothetical protein
MEISSQARAGIVALAFGMPSSIASNIALKDAANAAAWTLNAPIFTQHDCGIAPDDSPIHVEYVTETIGSPPPTLRICRAAALWAEEYRLEELHVVAAPPHLWRCLRDMRMALTERRMDIPVYGFADEALRDAYAPTLWFSAHGTQWYTNRAWRWRLRDFILKMTPWWLYSLIAG